MHNILVQDERNVTVNALPVTNFDHRRRLNFLFSNEHKNEKSIGYLVGDIPPSNLLRVHTRTLWPFRHIDAILFFSRHQHKPID